MSATTVAMNAMTPNVSAVPKFVAPKSSATSVPSTSAATSSAI